MVWFLAVGLYAEWLKRLFMLLEYSLVTNITMALPLSPCISLGSFVTGGLKVKQNCDIREISGLRFNLGLSFVVTLVNVKVRVSSC